MNVRKGGERVKVDRETRDRITSHYRAHQEAYDKIWSNLDSVRTRFEAVDRDGKIPYLKLSYINAVVSIRTSVEAQEEALSQLMAGENSKAAMSRVNYHRQKRKYIAQSLEDAAAWTDIASLLKSGDVDAAHMTVLDRLKYIGPVKAPFVLAKLGYTQKMCIDGNVARIVGLDDHPSTNDVHEYEEICRTIRSQFPILSDRIEPFHLHWVIFDWMRNNRTDRGRANKPSRQVDPVTSHDAWFNAVLNSPSEIKRVVDSFS